jgi:hypothetical protein
MDLGVVDTAVQTVAKLINTVKNASNYYSTNSLAEVAKITRVEPLTILSKDLLNLEYMPDVQNTLLNMFSAYYLQAIDIMTKVNNVEVIRMLDRLNPDRDSSGFLLSYQNEPDRSMFSMEAYKHSLPMKGVPSVGMEAEGPKNPLNEIANLAVGKLLNVRLGSDDKENKCVNLQIAVRLATSVVPDATILHLLSYKTEDNSLVERYHAWRSGRISFIRDLIFTQDLIDEWKRASIGDNTDTIQEIIRRVNNSKKYGLLTKNPSLVSASNLFVISEVTAREVEIKLGGKLSNPKVRQKAFDNTYAMVIAVVDREYQRVTFYTRGTAAATDVSIKELQAASKGKGPDITDMLRALNIGSPMSF